MGTRSEQGKGDFGGGEEESEEEEEEDGGEEGPGIGLVTGWYLTVFYCET